MVLVTGGAGFIGSHTVRALLAAGHRVVVADDLSTGRASNLDGLGVRLLEGDLRDADFARYALDGVERVIHLAAVASVPKSVADPVGTHGANYVATLNLLEGMREAGLTRIVYASSAAVYSPEGDAPHREDEYPDPTTPYGVDKLAGEFLLSGYARLHGLRPTSFRFFNVYGERQDPSSPYSGVISIFMDRLTSGRPITIFGDGGQTRDFVYAGDLARLLAFAAFDEDAPARCNVATGRTTTLNELLAAAERATGQEADASHAPARAGDIRISVADTSRIAPYAARAGVSVWTPLEEGLRRLAAKETSENPA